MRLGQDSGIGGLAQELDQEIHADGAVQNAGAQRGQGLSHCAEPGSVGGSGSAKSFLVPRRRTGQERIVVVIGGEDFAAVGRPANTQLVQEITRHFHEPGLDQDLVGRRVKVRDQLQHVRQKLDIGGDEQPVAALVRHGADAANQIADRPGVSDDVTVANDPAPTAAGGRQNQRGEESNRSLIHN